MTRYNLNPLALLALSPLTSPEASRPILNGVHFEPNGQGVATSGHILGVYREAIQAQSGGEALEAFTLWGPWAAIRTACRKALLRGKVEMWAVLDIPDMLAVGEGNNGKAPATLTVHTRKGPHLFAVRVSPQAVTCYPSWQQVVPRPESRSSIPALTLDADKPALFGGVVSLTFTTAERAVLVRTSDPDFLGVLMPCRGQQYDNGDPEQDWFRDIHGNMARAVQEPAA